MEKRILQIPYSWGFHEGYWRGFVALWRRFNTILDLPLHRSLRVVKRSDLLHSNLRLGLNYSTGFKQDPFEWLWLEPKPMVLTELRVRSAWWFVKSRDQHVCNFHSLCDLVQQKLTLDRRHSCCHYRRRTQQQLQHRILTKQTIKCIEHSNTKLQQKEMQNKWVSETVVMYNAV